MINVHLSCLCFVILLEVLLWKERYIAFLPGNHGDMQKIL